MTEILKKVEAHDRWRLEEVLNLQPSENVTSPAVRRILASDLGHRYTLPWKGGMWIHGASVENAYGGTRYLDEIEAEGEALAREVFHARFASLKPLSGHVAGMLLLLSACSKGDKVLVIDAKHGGYDGYMPEYLPKLLDLHLQVDFLPFDESRWNLDYAAAADKIIAWRPRLVLLGSSFLLFPFDLRHLRGPCNTARALLAYDGSHVLGLIAGGEFNRPLEEGADILIGSTHKSFPGPQGGLFLTNWEDVWAKFKENLNWRVLDNAHWNRIGGVAQTLLEMRHFGPAYAKAVVENARALAAALDRESFPVRFREFGFTRSHQIHLDQSRLREDGGLTPNEFSVRCGRNNLIVDAVARLGTAEVTRMGATVKDMEETASLIARAAKGEDVRAEVAAVRSRLRLTYVFE